MIIVKISRNITMEESNSMMYWLLEHHGYCNVISAGHTQVLLNNMEDLLAFKLIYDYDYYCTN